MMRKVIINENQRGLLFKDGRYVKMLDAGKYYEILGRSIEICETSQPIHPFACDLETLLKDKRILESVSVVEVGDEELALHYVNGKLSSVLTRGKHAFWSITESHEFKIVDISTPEVDESVPDYIFTKIPQTYYTKVEVAEYQKARLYFNQRLVRILDAGTYYFWKTPVKVEVSLVDTRLSQLNIVGQEILTADKVTVRINLVSSYRITDCVKIATEVDNFYEQLHVAAQLAIREYVGRYRLDEILENKSEMSEFIYKKLKEKETELFVEIRDAGVKDIILPGDIREIMNGVLVAEKRAQANVITRREEVASTRSLLNTARLMDENKTLYKLKELEYIERISENVGNISVMGSGSILTQLTSVLSGSNA